MSKSWLGVAVMLLLAGSEVAAHEFIVLPSTFEAKSGTQIEVRGLSTHVFFADEELEDEKDTIACIWDGGKRTSVPLSVAQNKLAFAGNLVTTGDKPFIVCGQRKAQLWASTPAGVKRGSRAEHPNATFIRSIEKFSKAHVNARAEDTSWSKPIGDRLEIVLGKNPASIRAGEEIPVTVLYDGQPIATRLYASYEGFSKRYMTFAHYSEMEKPNDGFIRISSPGRWLIRVEHTDTSRTDSYDRYVARAVVVFEVKP